MCLACGSSVYGPGTDGTCERAADPARDGQTGPRVKTRMRRRPLRLARLITMLLASGITLLIAAILLSTLPASATERYSNNDGWHYTQRPSPASTGRGIDLFVDRDFSPNERDRIVSAMRQWNYVLNGFVQFQARL